MQKKSDFKNAVALTPSTLKLHQLRANKDPNIHRLLTAEEISLLRKSKHEILEACRTVSQSKKSI